MNPRPAAPVLVALGFLLAGCAGHPTLTQDDWIRIKTRTYADTTPRQVVAAAEQLFRLADGKDFDISYSADGSGMKVTRSWWLFWVTGNMAGHEEWSLTATERPEGTWVGLDVTAAASAGLLILPGPDAPITLGPALYDLFFARLDYLLGRSQEWRTCDMQSSRKATWGKLEPLCFLADDAVPAGADTPTPVASPPNR